MTGRPRTPANLGFWPAMGAWVSKVQGPADPRDARRSCRSCTRPANGAGATPATAASSALAHAPFHLVGGKANKMKSDNMTLQGRDARPAQRSRRAPEGLRRPQPPARHARRPWTAWTRSTSQALGILTSSKLKDAIDLSKEDPKTLERYGVDDPAFERDGAPRMVRNFCIARRLVEAGARVVTMNFSRWDWHGPDGKNFVQARKDMPLLDRAVSALVDDLHDRGLDKDVSVVVWGEFGRTPKINKDASRDHWPQVSCALLAGGGMKTGQVIGASNRLAERAATRPVTHQEIFATLYRNLGLDLRRHPRSRRQRPAALPGRSRSESPPRSGVRRRKGGDVEAG